MLTLRSGHMNRYEEEENTLQLIRTYVFIYNINLMWFVLLIAICEDHHHCCKSSLRWFRSSSSLLWCQNVTSVNGSRLVTAFDDHIHYEVIKQLSDEGRTDRCVIVSFQQIKLGDVTDDWPWGWRTAMLDSRPTAAINTPLHESFHAKHHCNTTEDQSPMYLYKQMHGHFSYMRDTELKQEMQCWRWRQRGVCLWFVWLSTPAIFN